MTYLDPDHVQHINRARLINKAIKGLAVAAVAAFGWFALTVGAPDQSHPEAVSQPLDAGIR